MANIQIVPGSEVATPMAGQKINGSAFREAALMRGNVAATLGNDVADVFGEIGKKFQENRDARTILDADLAMRKTTDAYRDSLAKNPDEHTWIPGYQEQVNQVRNQVLNGRDVNPNVKRQLSAMLDRWDQATTSEIRTAAQLQSANRTKQTAIADYTYAARQGDEKGAYAAIQLGLDNHALFPEDADRMRREVPQLTQRAAIDTGIENNPIATLDLLKDQTPDGHSKKFPAIDPRTLNTLIVTAHNAMRKVQIEKAQEFSAEIDDAMDHQVDPQILKGARDAKEISAYDYERLDRRIKNYEKAGTEAHAKAETQSFQVAMLQADTPPADARDLETWAAEMKQNGLEWTNPAYRRRLNDYVDRKVENVKRTGKAEERPVVAQVMADLHKDFTEKDVLIPAVQTTTPATPAKTHWFRADEPAVPETTTVSLVRGGMNWVMAKASSEPDKKTGLTPIEAIYGKGITKDDVIESIRRHEADLTAKMRDWFNDPNNAKATAQQANDYRASLEQPYLLAAAGAALNHAIETDNPALSAQDLDAWHWAKQNPNDPMARQIIDKQNSKYGVRP